MSAEASSSRTLILVGPTAAGKTSVAHLVAEKIGSPILSADAMMVYRDMNIGTAKPSEEELARYQYSGINLVTPDRGFSVHDYLQSVDRTDGHRLVVGGTGLYVRALLNGLDGGSGEDPGLRNQAEAVLSDAGFSGLKSWCRNLLPGIDAILPEGDAENPRRWIRAVERHRNPSPGIPPAIAPEQTVMVGIARDRAELESRIRQRVEWMYGAGLLDEAQEVRSKYATLSPTAGKAIGYAEAFAVIDGKMDKREAIEKTVIRTRQYAKRQMTWFRNQFEVNWIFAGPRQTDAEIAEKVLAIT